MNRIITAFIAIGFATFATTSMAQPGPPSFDGLDTDENGELSKEEVTAFVTARMAGGGPRGGGAEGNRAGRGPNPEAMFGRWDTDGNGTVSREEFDARPRRAGRGGGNR